MSKELIRASVWRYRKSGKLVAFTRDNRHEGTTVLELPSNMSHISKIRIVKYIKKESIETTKYYVEFFKESISNNRTETEFLFHFVRVLSREDLDLRRWSSDIALDKLPILPYDEITPEEQYWAGKREGNLTGGFLLGAISLAFGYWSFRSYHANALASLLLALIAVFVGWRTAIYPWKPPEKQKPERIDALKAYKRRLKEKSIQRKKEAKSYFETLLEKYSAWEKLSPIQFENAISLRLAKEGFKVKTTQYSRDGGIDIEGIDASARPVIVQAKQYKNNVGVSVVREMIGIRESRADTPRTILFSLSGFTRGAQELAIQQNIELRCIKSELLKI